MQKPTGIFFCSWDFTFDINQVCSRLIIMRNNAAQLGVHCEQKFKAWGMRWRKFFFEYCRGMATGLTITLMATGFPMEPAPQMSTIPVDPEVKEVPSLLFWVSKRKDTSGRKERIFYFLLGLLLLVRNFFSCLNEDQFFIFSNCGGKATLIVNLKMPKPN